MVGVAFINWFINDRLKEDNQTKSRAELLIGFIISLSIASLAYATIFFIFRQITAFFMISTGGIFIFSSVFVVKYLGKLDLAANLVTGFFFYIIASIVFLGGGVLASASPWFAAVTLAGILIAGVKYGIIWGVCSAIYLSGLLALRLNGYQFPSIGLSEIEREVFFYTGYVGLTFITLAFGITFSVTISKVVARTKESRQIIQDNMDRLKELVSELEYVMNDFANGHFDRQLKTMHNNDEIDQLTIRLNQPITMLGEIISKLVVASTSVSGGSQNLSYSAKNLTKGSTEQASSLQQITASLSNIAERASQNNESAEDSYQLIEQTSKSVEEGNNSMQGLVQSMNEINDNSRKINGVIKTIDEIAFQTNLLALNAAVEAARAGKYGKGFAVVAEEVRNLATRSASAAKNTTDLIESSVKKIQDGVDKSNQTAKFFELIKGDVEKVETIVKNIAESSIEQNTGIGEINNSLSHVNNIVQNNSEIARETASTADELLSLSEQLQSLVKDFNKIS